MPVDFASILTAAVVAAVIAGLATNLLVPAVAHIATILQALDTPDARKDHKAPVPRMGGLAIALGSAC